MNSRIGIATALLGFAALTGCQNPNTSGSVSRAVTAPPSAGVWDSGVYRNLFVEAGYSASDVTAAVSNFYQQMFKNASSGQLVYHQSGTGLGYILAVDSNDVRTEGMSYGMMIAVQMNDQAVFNSLWNWAVTYMKNTTGDNTGYFAWQCHSDGSKMDANPAPDGEEYFATALFFAAKRWGNGTGIYNYEAQANGILDQMVAHRTIQGLPTWSGVYNLIDPDKHLVVFSCLGNSATFSDPSYNVPAFYELWARWATSSYYDPKTLWPDVAKKSRALLKAALNTTTFLGPDYSNFDGTPTGGNHADFRYDAWRIMQNLALDYAWWKADPWEQTAVQGLQSFFSNQGLATYGNQYQLNGTLLNEGKGNHSPGLVAMNAVGSLVSTQSATATSFVQSLWTQAPTTGNYRYYDNMLQMLGLLSVSGQYQIWGRGTGASLPSPTPSATPAPTTTPAPTSTPAPTATPAPTPTPSAAPAGQLSLSTATLNSGITMVSADGATVAQFSSASSYAGFASVDFGTGAAKNVDVRASAAGYGVNVLIRLDSPTGQTVATVYPAGGGTWATASNSMYPVPTGVHKVYVTVSAANTKINWIKFR